MAEHETQMQPARYEDVRHLVRKGVLIEGDYDLEASNKYWLTARITEAPLRLTDLAGNDLMAPLELKAWLPDRATLAPGAAITTNKTPDELRETNSGRITEQELIKRFYFALEDSAQALWNQCKNEREISATDKNGAEQQYHVRHMEFLDANGRAIQPVRVHKGGKRMSYRIDPELGEHEWNYEDETGKWKIVPRIRRQIWGFRNTFYDLRLAAARAHAALFPSKKIYFLSRRSEGNKSPDLFPVLLINHFCQTREYTRTQFGEKYEPQIAATKISAKFDLLFKEMTRRAELSLEIPEGPRLDTGERHDNRKSHVDGFYDVKAQRGMRGFLRRHAPKFVRHVENCADIDLMRTFMTLDHDKNGFPTSHPLRGIIASTGGYGPETYFITPAMVIGSDDQSGKLNRVLCVRTDIDPQAYTYRGKKLLHMSERELSVIMQEQKGRPEAVFQETHLKRNHGVVPLEWALEGGLTPDMDWDAHHDRRNVYLENAAFLRRAEAAYALTHRPFNEAENAAHPYPEDEIHTQFGDIKYYNVRLNNGQVFRPPSFIRQMAEDKFKHQIEHIIDPLKEIFSLQRMEVLDPSFDNARTYADLRKKMVKRLADKQAHSSENGGLPITFPPFAMDLKHLRPGKDLEAALKELLQAGQANPDLHAYMQNKKRRKSETPPYDMRGFQLIRDFLNETPPESWPETHRTVMEAAHEGLNLTLREDHLEDTGAEPDSVKGFLRDYTYLTLQTDRILALQYLSDHDSAQDITQSYDVMQKIYSEATGRDHWQRMPWEHVVAMPETQVKALFEDGRLDVQFERSPTHPTLRHAMWQLIEFHGMDKDPHLPESFRRKLRDFARRETAFYVHGLPFLPPQNQRIMCVPSADYEILQIENNVRTLGENGQKAEFLRAGTPMEIGIAEIMLRDKRRGQQILDSLKRDNDRRAGAYPYGPDQRMQMGLNPLKDEPLYNVRVPLDRSRAKPVKIPDGLAENPSMDLQFLGHQAFFIPGNMRDIRRQNPLPLIEKRSGRQYVIEDPVVHPRPDPEDTRYRKFWEMMETAYAEAGWEEIPKRGGAVVTGTVIWPLAEFERMDPRIQELKIPQDMLDATLDPARAGLDMSQGLRHLAVPQYDSMLRAGKDVRLRGKITHFDDSETGWEITARITPKGVASRTYAEIRDNPGFDDDQARLYGYVDKHDMLTRMAEWFTQFDMDPDSAQCRILMVQIEPADPKTQIYWTHRIPMAAYADSQIEAARREEEREREHNLQRKVKRCGPKSPDATLS